MLNIDSKKWKVTEGYVTNRATNEMRRVTGTSGALANMHERTFDQKCKVAFETGQWPS